MVTFPDYEKAGDNPYSVRESTRSMESKELLEWVERRIIRLGGVLGRSVQEETTLLLDAIVPIPVTKFTPTGAIARTTAKMKKLKCGHMTPRRKGAYPKRCPDCKKIFNKQVYQHIKLISKKL